MTAFFEAKKVEAVARDHVEPFIRQCSNGQFVPMFDDGPASRNSQSAGDGDYMAYFGGKACRIELKCEAAPSSKWNNFFLETWSNKSFGRARDGWMMTCKAEYLFYYFLGDRRLFVVQFEPLWNWFFGDTGGVLPAWTRYPEKSQTRYSQLNATCGHPVPIEDVAAEVGLVEFERQEDGTFRRLRSTRKEAGVKPVHVRPPSNN